MKKINKNKIIIGTKILRNGKTTFFYRTGVEKKKKKTRVLKETCQYIGPKKINVYTLKQLYVGILIFKFLYEKPT